MVRIAPSILSADLGRLAEEVRAAEAAGADWIHVDVMDGRFVPNITFGPSIVRAVRAATTLPVDVHLMVVEPERHLEAFAEAGADGLSVQVVNDPVAAGFRVSPGSFGWDGAYGTHFWVDPKEKLVAVMMVQKYPNPTVTATFQTLVYQSLVR